MAMVKKILLVGLSVFLSQFLLAQYDQSTKTYTLKYYQYYYDYGGSIYKYTFYKPFVFSYGVFDDFVNLDSLFTNSEFFSLKEKKEGSYRINLINSVNHDTISNIRWKNIFLPANNIDSNIFFKKLKYSYILHQIGEVSLDKTSSPKVRWFFNEDFNCAEGKWYLITNDLSTSKLRQICAEVNDTLGFGILNQKEKIIKERQQKKFQKLLAKLEEYESIEAIDPQNERMSFPMLLEYYDGKENHLFVYSNKKLVNKQLKKLIDKILSNIVVMRR